MRYGRDDLAISDRRTTYLHPQREFVSRFHYIASDTSDPAPRCIYSIFLMHRREDLWGPDGQFWFSSFMASYFLTH